MLVAIDSLFERQRDPKHLSRIRLVHVRRDVSPGVYKGIVCVANADVHPPETRCYFLASDWNCQGAGSEELLPESKTASMSLLAYDLDSPQGNPHGLGKLAAPDVGHLEPGLIHHGTGHPLTRITSPP